MMHACLLLQPHDVLVQQARGISSAVIRLCKTLHFQKTNDQCGINYKNKQMKARCSPTFAANILYLTDLL